MSNESTEKLQTLIKDYEERNPDFQSGKKRIFYLLSAFVGLRVILFILQTAYGIINHSMQFSNTILGIVAVLAALLFSFLIYKGGIKNFAYLSILAGLLSLYNAYIGQVFANFNTPDTLFNITNLFFVIAVIVQILVMLFIGIDKKCNVYFKSMREISKELSNLPQK